MKEQNDDDSLNDTNHPIVDWNTSFIGMPEFIDKHTDIEVIRLPTKTATPDSIHGKMIHKPEIRGPRSHDLRRMQIT